jgi:2-methylisocitrate lyase-like PEP mutase family enzyme
VARVSTGSVPYGAALHAAAQAARALRDGQPLPPSTPYADLQSRLVDYQKHSESG